MHGAFLFLSVFLASIVEGVEALTIVLAVGTTRSWSSAWYGIAAAGVVLAGFVAVLGPALTALPINALRLVIGGLLLTFGLQWLRKAILRASGFRPLHDEDAIFNKATAAATKSGRDIRKGLVDDWYSFTLAFKSVLLEGMEVAFIVVTFGANQRSIPLAIAGAASAVFAVVLMGIIARAPLTRVPENSLKFAVGIMLTSFGLFWGSEGAGVRWPGKDAALVGIFVFILWSALLQITWLRRRHNQTPVGAT